MFLKDLYVMHLTKLHVQVFCKEFEHDSEHERFYEGYVSLRAVEILRILHDA